MFYVYEWFIKDTNEVIYVGKGKNNRYKVKKHNNIFNKMINDFDCESRIVKTFHNEEDAFKYEYDLIAYYWGKNQCKCNINKGGTGGTDKWWNDELKNYYSKHNIMKRHEQRERMIHDNPMKNKEISQKVARKKSRAVIIKGKFYYSTKEAAEYFNKYPEQIQLWCKRGYDKDKKPCRYADEEQKIFKIKTTNSKAVIIDNKYFSSVKEAAKYYNVWSETIIRAIKNNKPFKGHICKYDNQQPNRENSGKSISEGSTTNK